MEANIALNACIPRNKSEISDQQRSSVMGKKMALWLLSLGWAVLLLTMVSETRLSTGGSIQYTLIGLAPLATLIGWEYLKAQRRSRAKFELLRLLGMQEGQGWLHAAGGSGIAVNPRAKLLALVANGHGKTYSYDNIRGWETVRQQAGEMYANSVSGGVIAAGHNVREAIAAAKATGFFVTVRDIEHPKWRVEMRGEADQARWMEIMRQEINGA